MQPHYVTLTSSGSTPWQNTNWHGVAPFNIGVTITCTAASSQYWIDVTMADPSSVYSGPVTVFLTSQIIGSSLIIKSSVNQIGSITVPIAALRLTSDSTTVNATLTWLQSGI